MWQRRVAVRIQASARNRKPDFDAVVSHGSALGAPAGAPGAMRASAATLRRIGEARAQVRADLQPRAFRLQPRAPSLQLKSPNLPSRGIPVRT